MEKPKDMCVMYRKRGQVSLKSRAKIRTKPDKEIFSQVSSNPCFQLHGVNHQNDLIIQPDVYIGRAKVYLRTWGCSHNSSDSEYMAGMLAAEGYGQMNYG